MKTKYQYSSEMEKEIDEYYLRLEKLKPLQDAFKQARVLSGIKEARRKDKNKINTAKSF